MITAAPCHLFCKWNTIYDLQFTFNCHGLLYQTRTAPVVTGLSWRYLSFSWDFWQWGGRLVHFLDVLIKRWSLKYLGVISASTKQTEYDNSPLFSTVSSWVFKKGDWHNLLYYLLFQSGGALGFFFVCLGVLLCVFLAGKKEKWKLFLEYKPAITGTVQPTIIPQTWAGGKTYWVTQAD